MKELQNLIFLFFLIGLGTYAYARPSCSDYSWENAIKKRHNVKKRYNKIVGQYNNELRRMKEISWTKSFVTTMEKALLEAEKIHKNLINIKKDFIALRKQEKVASDYQYSVHKACAKDGQAENADIAFDNYTDFYDWANNNTLYGDDDALDKTKNLIKDLKMNIERIKIDLKDAKELEDTIYGS